MINCEKKGEAAKHWKMFVNDTSVRKSLTQMKGGTRHACARTPFEVMRSHPHLRSYALRLRVLVQPTSIPRGSCKRGAVKLAIAKEARTSF
jgi:hypothetical protein